MKNLATYEINVMKVNSTFITVFEDVSAYSRLEEYKIHTSYRRKGQA